MRNFGRVLSLLAALSVGATPALMSSCGGSKGMGHYMTSKAEQRSVSCCTYAT